MEWDIAGECALSVHWGTVHCTLYTVHCTLYTVRVNQYEVHPSGFTWGYPLDILGCHWSRNTIYIQMGQSINALPGEL
jgi:hypothetical protein